VFEAHMKNETECPFFEGGMPCLLSMEGKSSNAHLERNNMSLLAKTKAGRGRKYPALERLKITPRSFWQRLRDAAPHRRATGWFCGPRLSSPLHLQQAKQE
jgi:hypothetical protein